MRSSVDPADSRLPVWLAALQLAGLWALAVVQPLFDLLGRNAQFFVARGNTGGDIVLFALGLTLVPPLILAVLEAIAWRIRPRLGWGVHLAFLALLVALIVLPPAGDLLGGSSLAIGLALAVGAAAAALYARFAQARPLLTFLAPAPLLFLVLFLVMSPVSKLVFPAKAEGSAVGQSPSSTPVVLVVFDELAGTSLMGPGGKVDAKQFPNFARLAATSTWYRNATTVAPDTTQAVPALLTGNRPRKDQLPTAADHPRSLFTLLGRSHDLNVIEPITSVCPESLCGERRRPGREARLRLLQHDLRIVSAHLLLPDDLRTHLPAVDQGWEGFGIGAGRGPGRNGQQAAAKERVTQPARDFERFIASMRPGTRRPPLAVLHVELPHIPWRYLPDGSQYIARRDDLPGLKSERWVGGQWLADQGFQRHLLQLGYADRMLGRLLDRLESAGLFDRAVVAVAADHGVSFRGRHPRRSPDQENFADIAGVPLIIKAPQQRKGRVDDSAVRTIDVVPTIARELGDELPWRLDGRAADKRSDDPDADIDIVYKGKPLIELPFERFRRLRDERERDEERLLGPRDSPYGIGTRPDLVGRRLSDFAVETEAAGATVELDAPDDLASGEPVAGFVASFVSGAVTGAAAGTDVALVVDGRVQATTRLRRESGETVFAALVPPDVLGTGAVAVYRIMGDRRLRPFADRTRRDPYRFVDAGAKSYLEQGRRRIPIDDGVRGFVDNGLVQDGVVRLYGWAARADLGRRADLVVAFAGRRQVAAVRPSIVREELAAQNPGLRQAGFALRAPLSSFRSGGANVRVFGILGGHATPLTPGGTAAEVLSSLR